MNKFKDCLNKGLIRKERRAENRVEKSIEIAKKFLLSAKNTFNIAEYEMCLIASYNSIFHSCRALLFRKGYVEKSHFCLTEAIKDLYKSDKLLFEFLNSIDKIRLSRHEVQYQGVMAFKEEAEFVSELSKDFLDYIKEKLLKD